MEIIQLQHLSIIFSGGKELLQCSGEGGLAGAVDTGNTDDERFVLMFFRCYPLKDRFENRQYVIKVGQCFTFVGIKHLFSNRGAGICS